MKRIWFDCSSSESENWNWNRKESEATAVAISHSATAILLASQAVILTGAGISTNSGIPDFRSATSGLYTPSTTSNHSNESPSSSPTTTSSPFAFPQTLKRRQNLRQLFDSNVFLNNNSKSQHLNFISLLHDHSKLAAPTRTHDFFVRLKELNKLKRVYTQNIDALESHARVWHSRKSGKKVRDEDTSDRKKKKGRVITKLDFVRLPGVTRTSVCEGPNPGNEQGAGMEEREEHDRETFGGDVVQLHGSLNWVRCTSCPHVEEWAEHHSESFQAGQSVECPACHERANKRRRLLKRSPVPRSFLRPSIVLYNEPSPSSLAIGQIVSHDLHYYPSTSISSASTSDSDSTSNQSPDLLLVMGTSLRIPGFKALVKDFAKVVLGTARDKGGEGLRILVNNESVGKEWDDVFDYHFIADCDDFVRRIEEDWEDARPSDFRAPERIRGDSACKKKRKKTHPLKAWKAHIDECRRKRDSLVREVLPRQHLHPGARGAVKPLSFRERIRNRRDDETGQEYDLMANHFPSISASCDATQPHGNSWVHPSLRSDTSSHKWRIDRSSSPIQNAITEPSILDTYDNLDPHPLMEQPQPQAARSTDLSPAASQFHPIQLADSEIITGTIPQFVNLQQLELNNGPVVNRRVPVKRPVVFKGEVRATSTDVATGSLKRKREN
ncbi:DHS-like NAD/FAD-binding domain-containing protein [Meredithblackwellia eburnea MCA 4105]